MFFKAYKPSLQYSGVLCEANETHIPALALALNSVGSVGWIFLSTSEFTALDKHIAAAALFSQTTWRQRIARLFRPRALVRSYVLLA
jgi:hypothetical protein